MVDLENQLDAARALADDALAQRDVALERAELAAVEPEVVAPPTARYAPTELFRPDGSLSVVGREAVARGGRWTVRAEGDQAPRAAERAIAVARQLTAAGVSAADLSVDVRAVSWDPRDDAAYDESHEGQEIWVTWIGDEPADSSYAEGADAE
jgi:hypothetical protein